MCSKAHGVIPETIALQLLAPSADDHPDVGRSGRSIYADLGEAVTYCPECAEREFGETTR